MSSYQLIEHCCIGKRGDPELCEDDIYAGEHFVAVIDGATSKSALRWSSRRGSGDTMADGTMSGGRMAAQVLREALSTLAANASAVQAVTELTRALHDVYEDFEVVRDMLEQPVRRLSASVVAVNVERRELWRVGDCAALVDGALWNGGRAIDQAAADARAAFLEAELAAGKTLRELRANDTGRVFILPLLERQARLQNHPEAGAFWYPAMDGFAVPAQGIAMLQLPERECEVVLASDGYPVLLPTLGRSEVALAHRLEADPLCFRLHRATKGMAPGDCSFDDRAYVRIRLPARAG